MVLLVGCDPYWQVKRQSPFFYSDKLCIEGAISNTEGVLEVTEKEVSQSYSITGKELPKPTIWAFSTELNTGFVELHQGNVKAYFMSLGTKVPPDIENGGPKYLDAVIANIEKTCNVKNSTANKAI